MKNDFGDLEPLNNARENIKTPKKNHDRVYCIGRFDLVNLELDENLSPNIMPLSQSKDLKEFEKKEALTQKRLKQKFIKDSNERASDKSDFFNAYLRKVNNKKRYSINKQSLFNKKIKVLENEECFSVAEFIVNNYLAQYNSSEEYNPGVFDPNSFLKDDCDYIVKPTAISFSSESSSGNSSNDDSRSLSPAV